KKICVYAEDAAGNSESDLWTTAIQAPNAAATGKPSITGTAKAGETLTAAKGTIADANGVTKADNGDTGFAYTYQWVRVDSDGSSNATDISGAMSQTYTLAADDVGKKVKVRVGFKDDLGNAESRTSDAFPSAGTIAAAGSTTTPSGSALWSATLTVDHASTRTGGLNAYGCDNQRSTTGVALDNCSDKLTEDEFVYPTGGTTYTVERLYNDGSGQNSTLELEFAGVTASNAKTALTGLTLTVGTGMTAKTFAIADAGASGQVLSWTSGLSWSDRETVALKLTAPAATKPAKPAGLTATAGDAQVALSWDDPGDSSITGYQYLQKTGNAEWGATWTDIPSSAPGETNATSYTVTSLANGTAYRFRIRAVNAQGESPQSDATDAVTPVADTTGPSVTGALAITSDAGTYSTDDDIEVTVTFDEAIVVVGTPELKIRVGTGTGSEKTATCERKGGTGEDAKKLVCTYTVVAGDEDTDGVSVAADKLSLPTSPAATIKDSSDNDATLTHDALAAQGGHLVDAVAPAITGLAMASTPAATGVYAATETVKVEVTFSEAVTVTIGAGESIALALKVGAANEAAACAHKGGTGEDAKKLTCAYTVAANDEDTDGVSVDAGSLTLSGNAAIADSQDIAAAVSHAGLAAQGDHKVDAVAPAAPVNLAAAAGNAQVRLTWDDPSPADASIAKWQVRRKSTGEYGDWADIAGGAAVRAHDVTGLVNGTAYTFEVRAADAASNEGAAGTAGPATPTANSAATGKPTISGIATVGKTLTAAKGTIADADGVTKADNGDAGYAYTYQWVRVDSDGTGNPTDISGATSKTYVLAATDAGKKVKVKVGFQDDLDNAETRTSDAFPSTGTVSATDTTGPTVSTVAITSNPRAGTGDRYAIGDDIVATVTFDEAVFLNGSPELALRIGPKDRTATCAKSAADATKLLCTYTVQEGDEDTDGIAIEEDRLSLPTSPVTTVKDSSSNDADLDHDALAAQGGHKVDGKKPAVTGVAFTGTPKKSGTFTVGETVGVTVTFGEAVTVTGKPGVDLRFRTSGIDGVTKKATYVSGSGTATLTFGYTVESGIRHEALDAGTLRGTIRDAAGNAAKPAHGGVPRASRVKVDAIGPAATGYPRITSSAPAGGAVYRTGEKITFALKFDEALSVSTDDGTPTLDILVGSTTREAAYDAAAAGSDKSWAHFSYVVQAGDLDLDGVTVPADGVALNDGTIADLLGNAAASLDHGAFPTSSRLTADIALNKKQQRTKVNGLAAADVAIVSETALTVQEGATARYTVKLKAPPAGTLTVTPTSGDTAVATVSTAAAANTLTFTEANWSTAQAVTVAGVEDDDSTDGTVTVTHPLSGAGYGGKSATPVAVTVTDDEGVPTVVGAPAVTSTPAVAGSKTYGQREKIKVTIAFSEAITVTGAPQLKIKVGAAERTATCARKGNTAPDNARLVCTYTVSDGDADADGIEIEADKLELPSGVTVTDGTSDAELDHAALGAQDGHRVDGTPPAVSDDDDAVAVAAPAAGEHYVFGEKIAVTVRFTEAVTVVTTGGTPRLKVAVGGNDRWAAYGAGTGTTSLQFAYTVAGGESDTDGIEVRANSLELNGGKIRDAVNNADLGHGGVEASSDRKVDGVRPRIVGAPQFTGMPAARNTYAAGEKIGVTVTFSEAVTVTGEPGFEIELRKVNVQTHQVLLEARRVTADYKSGSGTTKLVFEYEVASGDWDGNGITYAANAAKLNGGSIKDANGNPAVLSHVTKPGRNAGQDATRKVDALRPTVESVGFTGGPAAGGVYAAGEAIRVTVKFREAVAVTGTPQVALDIGGTERKASYTLRRADGKTLEFSYTVVAADGDADGISIGENALTLNDGTIKDANGNAANLDHGAVGRQAGRKVNGGSAAGGVRVSKGALTIAEGGRASYTVRLTKAPVGGSVTVTPVVGDTDAASVRPSPLTFTGGTTGNWNAPQAVTVTAKQDTDSTDENFGITHTVSGANYGSVTAPSVRVRVTDDDADPAILWIRETSRPASGDTYLFGETVQVTVRYNEPVFVTGKPHFEVTIGGSGRQAPLVSGAGTPALAFEHVVKASDRERNRISYPSNKALAGGGGTIRDADGNAAPRRLDGVRNVELSRHKVDGSRSAAGVRLSRTEVTVPEGGSGSYTVRLLKRPGHSVTVAVSVAGDTDITVDPASLSFTPSNWSSAQTVTVRAAADTDAVNGTATVSHAATSADAAYAGIAIRSVTAFEADSSALPARPANFRALPANGKVTLSWNDPEDAGIVRWEVRQKTGGGAWGGWTRIADSGAATRFHDVTGLENGTEYAFQVRAVNATGEGPPSDEATATPSTNVAAAPDKVAGVSVAAGAAQLTVTWDAVAGASGYKVQWKSGTEAFAAGRQATPTATRHVIADLTPGTEYTVRVIATKANAPDGMPSDEATGTPAFQVPAAPTGLSAAKDGRFAIDLSWTAPAADAARAAVTGYEVEWSADGNAPWADVTTITVAATVTHEDGGLAAGTTRHYRVRATSSAGTGAWSATASATTDANAAPVITAGATATFEVAENTAAGMAIGATDALKATDADGDTVSYALGGTDAADFAFDAASHRLKVKGALDHEAKASHSLTVTAGDGHGGSDSIAVTVTVTDVAEPPSAPTGLSVAAQGTTVLRATWTAPADTGRPAVTGYDVQHREGTDGDWSDHTHAGTAVTADISGLTPGTAHQVRVRAKNDEGEGAWTTPVSGTTAAGPAIDSIAITSSVPADQDGHYRIGDVVKVTATFDKALTVTGSPTLKIRVGTAERTATCAKKGTTGEDAKKLECSYTVAEGDADANGIAVEAGKLTGTITDGTTAANLAYTAISDSVGHKVDGVRPTVSSAGHFSDAAAMTALTGPVKGGVAVYTKVTFSEDVKHVKDDGTDARPELSYSIGTTDVRYDILDNADTLASGDCKPNHATETDEYVCLYTVGSSVNGSFTVKAGTASADKAGNTLASEYTHDTTLTLDNTVPAKPSALALASGTASPGNDATPEIEVTVGEAGGTVTLYRNNTCTTAASAATAVTDTESPFKVTVPATALTSDGSVTFHAKHADAAQNESACSTGSVAYVHDGTDPGI
ncbi:MAG: hypothetical protein F4213_14945, partial [Boseongicola sp. SB0677_bin_26]|nr:hypothetical protein [Boseongicola sp. SB0677_bin_26]